MVSASGPVDWAPHGARRSTRATRSRLGAPGPAVGRRPERVGGDVHAGVDGRRSRHRPMAPSLAGLHDGRDTGVDGARDWFITDGSATGRAGAGRPRSRARATASGPDPRPRPQDTP